MPAASLTRPLAVAGVLLLTACGTQEANSRSDGSSQPRGPGATEIASARPCPAESAGASTAPRPSASPRDRSDGLVGGVTVITVGDGPRACAQFQVTNHEAEPFTYTISFTAQSATGEALANTEQTVASVPPGRTVRRTVVVDDLPGVPADGGGVKITKVRGVPADEAPASAGSCPASGVRVHADEGSAAMGLRAVSLRLENCGTRVTRLNGYPLLQLLDDGHQPLGDVRVLHGGSAIATGTGADGEPRPLAVRPGERAYAVLVWRNTVDNGAAEPAHAPYVRVRAKPGADPVMVTPELDVGTTGRVGIGPWKKDETAGGGATRPTASGAPSGPAS
ncbi:DUF4232 domain-containing protein [Streptomyces sp. 71268]|uniref:DUF4232 domain-containing protein n=1 Tax=Streptomyces sp. 71268 TaxID=3002640 RepID=UPI0023F65FE6|nr:DUF4232 domain-containing protein [Streptomyces sp. 71268]WEV28966.1 DUF4232 domain-containing protein [Streptomyces sp. 71268]